MSSSTSATVSAVALLDASALFDAYDINGSDNLEVSELLFLIHDAIIIRDNLLMKPKMSSIREEINRVLGRGGHIVDLNSIKSTGQVGREVLINAITKTI